MKSLGEVFKQVYEEGLKEYGFVKVKGKQPYFVRVVGGEILHVITYITRPSLQQGKKEYTIMGGVATVYRRTINFNETPKNNSNWMNTVGEFYSKINIMKEPIENLNKWYSFTYGADNKDSLIKSVQDSFEIVNEIMLPILDEVKDIKKCIEYFEIFHSNLLVIHADEDYGQQYNDSDYNEGLLNVLGFNTEQFIHHRACCVNRMQEIDEYLICIGKIGYTLQTYEEEKKRMHDRMIKRIKIFENIVGVESEKIKVLKELETRKKNNINELQKLKIIF